MLPAQSRLRVMSLTDAAAAVGIATGYHDIWGQWRATPETTIVAALGALGYPGAPDPAAIVRAVDEHCRVEAARLMPELMVVATNVQLRLALPASRVCALAGAGDTEPIALEWRVMLDSGDVLAGSYETRAQDSELALPPLPIGVHRLRLCLAGAASAGADTVALAEAGLLVEPEHCHLPPPLARDARQWGLAVQLYGLRSMRNWGIGDFTDLHALIDAAALLGARVVGLNPLHALSLDRAQNASPYSAVSRLFLHPLYIDPMRVEGFREPSTVASICGETVSEPVLSGLREAAQVDYPAVSRIKLQVLRRLFEHFLQGGSTSARQAFAGFRSSAPGLRVHATFQSIQIELHRDDPSVWGWPRWPQALRDPASAAVGEWQQSHAEDIAFHEFLEWQARLQWQQVRAHARSAGVALYGDLALGADLGGSEVWAAQDDYALPISTGCPPDDFNLKGQDWGLPPYRPDRLPARACAPFRQALQANMALYDALRLDHVMSLMRLFWIPSGAGAGAGTYVDYPFAALMACLKIESVRSACMVIGEDLGTVPPAVRTGLQAADVLSYRLLVFERESATRFRAPDVYPRLSLASVGSHDLSPLQGWWIGHDLQLRQQLGLLDAQQFDRFSWDRGEARQGLLATLAELGLLPPGASTDPGNYPSLPAFIVDAVHAMLARTGSMWVMVNPEDVFDLVEATNLPGTTHEHANWVRRLPVPVEAWAAHPRMMTTACLMREVRG